MGQRKKQDPQTYDSRTNGNDNPAHASVCRMGAVAAPNEEELPNEPNNKNYATDHESKPRHGYPFYT
jgi:hypothetical protein